MMNITKSKEENMNKKKKEYKQAIIEKNSVYSVIKNFT